MGYWDGRMVIVTGGSGFLGSFVVKRLKVKGEKLQSGFRAVKQRLRPTRPRCDPKHAQRLPP